MLERIRQSFVNPGALIQYRNDSLIKALGYMLFFALFTGTSMLLMVLSFEGVSANARRDIMNELKPLEANCEIVDARLSCDESTQHTFYEMANVTFSINTESSHTPSDYQANTMHFIIHESSLLIYGRTLLGPVTYDIPLSDLDSAIHNFDLNTLETNPALFEYTVFQAVDDFINQYKLSWGSLFVSSSIFSGLLLFFIFILLNTLLTRSRLPMVPFKQMFVMMTYAGTALYVVLIFNNLWNFSFFILIIFLLVAFRQMNRLTLEIQNRLYRNKP